ncbi:MAG: lipoyl domain-containing protein [Bacteroidales bacterium]
MIKEIKLPEIADNVDTAVVLEVLVSVGDKVEKDDSLAEMESDKATFEMPSEESGTVKEIRVKDGDEVKVGQVMFTIDTSAGGEQKGEPEEKEEVEEKKEDTQAAEEKKAPEKEKEEKMPEEKKEVSEKVKEPEKDRVEEEEESTGGESALCTADRRCACAPVLRAAPFRCRPSPLVAAAGAWWLRSAGRFRRPRRRERWRRPA